MKKKIPLYLKELLKLNPKLSSGRRNYQDLEKRVEKNIKLTKKYFKNKKS
tara:strand:+ start:1228 stop:1377 length:150 start_codon:yes stop_codon:yes gene_type:complete